MEFGKASTRLGRHSQELDFMTHKIKHPRNCNAEGNVKFVFKIEMVNIIVYRAIEHHTKEV